MNSKKGKKGFIVWASVASSVIALLLIVTILASTVFFTLINTVFGGKRPIFAPGVEAYYLTDYTSKEEVFEAAKQFNVKLGDEGYVLLKNNGSALPVYTPESEGGNAVSQKPKISIFGKNSVNLAYGGTGSSAFDVSQSVDLYTALEEAGYSCNPELKKFYNDTKRSGPVRETSGSDLDSGDTVVLSTAETPQSMYDSAVKDSYSAYSDVALIVITRVAGEGMDLPRQMKGATGYKNEDDHFLEFDKNETDLINAVSNGSFDKVVIVLNTGSAMELGEVEDNDGVDSIIWMGYPGMTGTRSLGRILNGSVNPSGHTVDTFVRDLKADPTWNNFGDNRITGNYDAGIVGGDQYSVGGKPRMYYFVDYEEDIYVGYRYYETAYAEHEAGNFDAFDYDQAVVYPFGYGLSYTSFTWTIEDDSSIRNKAIGKDGKYEITVKVHNDGDVAGMDVVQLYGHAPYNPKNLDTAIEKPEVVLLDFAKTELIEPGKDATVTLTVDPYYLASYDCYDNNGNDFKGYELEASDDYMLYVAQTSHDRSLSIPFVVSDDITYSTDPVTDYEVENRYTEQADPLFNSDTQLSVKMSRSDFEGTWPTTPDAEEREVDENFIKALDDVSHNNPIDENEVEMPWTDGEKTMVLRDMLFDENGEIIDEDGDGIPFVDYDDSRWLTLLEQLSVSEMKYVCNNAAYIIQMAETIGLPQVLCADGPVGWTCLMNSIDFYGTCNYVSQITVGATWNKDLVYEYGEMVGDEGLLGNGNGVPYSGWYAPGVNIHRSAFGGRNFEYFSEDPVLSGKLAASEIRGAQSKGVFVFLKHFALNEQETHRSISGDCSWVTEQAMREIYLRSFEIAVKEGETRGIMSSFNRIGTRWTGGDYRLLTEILRNEWGFRGSVISDFNTIPKYMNSRQMAYAGGNLNLATMPVEWADESSAADVAILSGLMKDICYTVVNSNAMNGEILGYKLPIWQLTAIILDVVVVCGMAVWGVFAVRGFIRYKKSENAAKENADNNDNV